MVIKMTIYNKKKMEQKEVYPGGNTPSYSDWALFDMGAKLETDVMAGGVVPEHTSEDAGKVLKVTAQNELAWATDEQGHAQVQSNWNETDNTQPSYIQNKPTIPDGVPAHTAEDAGKMLSVNAQNLLVWAVAGGSGGGITYPTSGEWEGTQPATLMLDGYSGDDVLYIENLVTTGNWTMADVYSDYGTAQAVGLIIYKTYGASDYLYGVVFDWVNNRVIVMQLSYST